jgi:hypothetical protein
MLLPVQDCGKGVNLDLLPSELAPGVWSDSSNVRFRNGFARKRKGFEAAYTTPTEVPYWIGTYSTATSRYVVQLGIDSAFVDDGSTRTDITPGSPPTGVRDERWTGFDFNGVFVCNNGKDAPYYWTGDTTDDLDALPDWPADTIVDALRPFKEYIFGIAPTISGTKYPYRVMWGSAAEPGSLPATYTAAATNDAGDKDVPGIGHLIDGLILGDAFILYGQEGRVAMRYIGGTLVFSFQRLPGSDGLLTRGCVVNTPKGHVFLTNGDVRIHAGGESQSIAEGWVRDYLASTMDSTNAARSFVTVNPRESEVWVVFPSTGMEDCDTVLAWNWIDGAWAKFTVPNLTYATSGLISSALSAELWSDQDQSWDQTTNTWSQNEAASNAAQLIVATSTPGLALANVGSLDFGERIEWHLEKRGIPLSVSVDELKPISRMRPHLDAAQGAQVTVKLATTRHPDDDPTFSASSTFTQGASDWVNQFTKAGRYGAVRIEGADDLSIALKTYQLEVANTGGRF